MRTIGLVLAAVLLGATTAAAGLPAKQRPFAERGKVAPGASAGRLVYQKWCAECHDPGPNHPGTQSLAVKYRGKDVAAALVDRGSLPPATTQYFVRHGFALMPQFRKTEISDAQLHDLATYLAEKK